MTNSRLIILLAAALLLSCSSDPKQVESKQGKDSRDRDELFSTKPESFGRPALEIPPDLLASSSAKVQANKGGSAGADATGDGRRVLPEVIGATIQSDSRKSWLEIDADAEVVWRKLTEFWAFHEVELVEYSPESGLMETDWFVKTGNDSGGVASIASDFLKAFIARRTAVDKFELRLERNRAKGTNLFVTHRRREKIASEPTSKAQNVDYQWVEREPDAEKVMRLLQTIVLLFDSGAEDVSESGSDGEDPA